MLIFQYVRNCFKYQVLFLGEFSSNDFFVGRGNNVFILFGLIEAKCRILIEFN